MEGGREGGGRGGREEEVKEEAKEEECGEEEGGEGEERARKEWHQWRILEQLCHLEWLLLLHRGTNQDV